MVSWCMWNDIYFYFILSFLNSISAPSASGFCHCPCHQHHTLHLEHHLLFQIHLVGLGIFCWFSSETYHHLVLLQRVVSWTFTCHIYMQMWLKINILGCDTLNWHQLWSCSTCLLIWVVYCLMLVSCVLAVLVPSWTLLGPGTATLFHWVLALWQSCCTIQLFHLSLVVPVSAVLVVFLTLFNESCCVYATHLGSTWYGFPSSLTLGGQVPLKHPIPVNMLLNSLYILIVLALVALSVSMSGPAAKYSASRLTLLLAQRYLYHHFLFWTDFALFFHWFVIFGENHLLFSSSQLVVLPIQTYFLALQRNCIYIWYLC